VTPSRLIELTEYKRCSLGADLLSDAEGEELWRSFGSRISVEFPSPKTKGQWELTSQGWVGLVPLNDRLRLQLLPRIPLQNLFAMWEYAYKLDETRLPGLVDSDSIEDFYSRLAGVLAKRILLRLRKGIYKSYRGEADELGYVRGALDFRDRMKAPWKPSLLCDFEEHTPDIVDNQILAWTLFSIARSGLCRSDSLGLVQSAYRRIASSVSLEPHGAEACSDRLYDRLNEDYQPLHALCSFFLAHSGPHYLAGKNRMIPFLFEMPRLYEMFVAEWLLAHKSEGLNFEPHCRVTPDGENGMTFDIDIVLRDASEVPLCVLDTKYKTDAPSTQDVYQVVTYALSMGCEQAFLVYPMELSSPLDISIGPASPIRVTAVGFDISGDLGASGARFLEQVVATMKGREVS